MKKSRIQSEKLFTHQELEKLIKKLDTLTIMEKIEKTYSLRKIFRNWNFH